MKSLMLLLRQILADAEIWCHTSTSRDLKTITARVEDEGLSFLTITLPNFGKDFEKSLDQGFVDRSQFQGFAFTASLPRLFGGFFDLVFDRSTGRLLDVPSIEAIRTLRQVTLMFGKAELPCTDVREKAAFDKYIECEKQLRVSDAALDPSLLEDFGRISLLLYGDIFSKVDLAVYNGEILPKHSDGATADRLRGNAKYDQKQWTTRLEKYFPCGEFLFPSWTFFLENSNHVELLEPGAELPVKVISVPKTLKTPRIIAMEPTAMQYAQQGIMTALRDAIDEDNLSRSFISWSTQVPNQELARLGSLNGELATLDLSEASDRVSNQQVRYMLRNHPHLAGAVDATRSRKADVPGHGIIRLTKFASMGSSLCFPFEAIVFSTIIFLGIEKAINRRLTKADLKGLLGKVRVYGDDIIIPVEYVSSVVHYLETFGLKVNSSKSFWTGKFRESCGKEYFDGHDVSIVKVRQLLPTQQTHVEQVVATVSTRNQFYKAGYWMAVRYLDSILERIIPFPAVTDESPALGKYSFLGYSTESWNTELQKPMVKAAVVSAKLPVSKLDGYGALMKFFLRPIVERSLWDPAAVDKEHLLRAGRPVSVDIKIRKTSPF